MNCRKAMSRLHAYVDGEMPLKFMREIEEHLNACPSCRMQAEHIRRLDDVLDGLTVPPLPRGFSARIMAEASSRAPIAKEKKSIFSLGWGESVRWLLDLPVSMRLAACSMILAACLLGVFMSKELSLSGNPQAVAGEEGLEGFEWFSPTPPASLGSAYVSLAWQTTEKRDRP